MNEKELVRRDIKARGASWAKTIAGRLVKTGITPNQISILSVVFAALGGGLMVGSYYYDGLSRALTLVGAAVCVQLRLLCNLFDGMVAVEGGKKTASGEVFNDLPDRIADPIIIISAGYAVKNLPWVVELAWLAGILSVLTAYVRVLGGACGIKQDFVGPMAKQHRMAILTIALVLSAIFVQWFYQGWILYAALAMIVVGCFVTLTIRSYRIVVNLEKK